MSVEENLINYFELIGLELKNFPSDWEAKGFIQDYELESHFLLHGKGVGAKDSKEYLEMAKNFFYSSLGESGDAFVAENGDIYKFDENTLFFAVAGPNGIIKTFFNLGEDKSRKSAIAYWKRKIEKNKK